MQDTNRDGRTAPDGDAPDWDTRPERRRSYPEEAPPPDWEDEHIDLGGEG